MDIECGDLERKARAAVDDGKSVHSLPWDLLRYGEKVFASDTLGIVRQACLNGVNERSIVLRATHMQWTIEDKLRPGKAEKWIDLGVEIGAIDMEWVKDWPTVVIPLAMPRNKFYSAVCFLRYAQEYCGVANAAMVLAKGGINPMVAYVWAMCNMRNFAAHSPIAHFRGFTIGTLLGYQHCQSERGVFVNREWGIKPDGWCSIWACESITLRYTMRYDRAVCMEKCRGKEFEKAYKNEDVEKMEEICCYAIS